MDTMFDPDNGLSVADRPKALADRLGGLWEMISEVSENLPPATLRWRIQNWLSAGQGRVDRGLADMKVGFLQFSSDGGGGDDYCGDRGDRGGTGGTGGSCWDMMGVRGLWW